MPGSSYPKIMMEQKSFLAKQQNVDETTRLVSNQSGTLHLIVMHTCYFRCPGLTNFSVTDNLKLTSTDFSTEYLFING